MDRLEPRLMLSAHYYAFTASAETWTAAEQEAVSHGGHLVSITSQAEQDFVTQHFVQNNPSYVFWIGLNDQAQKYTWQWSNGDPVTYTNWNGGLFSSEPNDLHGEDYGSINWHYVHRGDVLGTWNDEPNGGVDGSVDVFSQGNPEPHFGIMEFNAPPTGISNTVVSYDDDSDDRISGATALGDMTQTHGVEGDISDPLDADLYSFSAAAGQNVSFDIDSIVPNDKFGSYMRLFDSSGNILAVDAHAKPGILSLYQHSIENLAYHFNSGGTYYLGVSGLGNNAYDPITGNGDAVGDTGKYSLNVFPGVAGTVYRQGDDTAYSADLQSSGNGPIDPSKDAWIIIHGRNSSRENMAGLEGAVHIALGQMQRDDQVMTLDWSGAAHSAGVGFGGENAIVNVGQWAADALADIGFAGSQIHLIGHSWGSYVADELAQRIPYIKGHAIDFVDTIVALDPATDAPATLPGYNYNPDEGHINFNDHSRYSWAFHTSILGSEYTPTTADEAFVYTNDNINPTISHSQAVDRFAAMIANTGNHVSEYFSLGRLLAGPSGPARPWQPDHYSSDAVPSGMTLYATDGYEARLTADDGGVEPYELRYFDSSHHEITIYASDPDDGSQDTPIVKSIIAATGPGTPAMIYDLDPNGQLIQSFVPFDGFTNGLTIASGDINADGTPDIIVAAGPGGATNIRVFDGKTGEEIAGPLGSFLAYPGVGGSAADPASTFYTGAFQGQINLAAGDINGDGHDDIIVSIAAAGPPHLKVFSGADGSELMSLLVYPGSDNINDPAYFGNSFQGGVRIASGDVTGDGRDDILTAAGPGAGPHVKVYDGVTHAQVKSYYAYDPGYAGGVRVAAGDYNGDGVADIITAAGIGVGPHVKAINASDGTELASFWAYDPGFTGGIWVASADLDGDGKAEILTIPGSLMGPEVKIFHGGDGSNPSATADFFAFDQNYTGGSRIATA